MKGLITLLFVLFSLIATAQSKFYDSLFVLGNMAMDSGQYEEARSNYEQIIEAGLESFKVYYNLGNAWFRTGDIPEAILNYERARRLRPDDNDVVYNLNLAREQISDEIETLPVPFYVTWFRGFVFTFPSDVWAILNLVLTAVAFILFFIYLISSRISLRRLGFYGGLLFLFLGIMTFIFGQIEVNDIRRTNEAIVFAGTVNVQSEPKEGSTILFVIHEGLKVEILESEGSWDRIILPNGSIGWIERSTIIII